MLMDVYLKKLEQEDALQVMSWRNENAEFFGDQRPLTPLLQKFWFADYLRSLDDHMYVVMAGSAPHYTGVGTIGLRVKSREIQRVMLGYKSYARTGVMSLALVALMRGYGHGEYVLHVKKENHVARTFYERNGFYNSALAAEDPTMVRMYRYFEEYEERA